MENKNEQKNHRRRANRILYIAVAAVICVGAVVCGILLSRRGEEAPLPVVETPDDNQDVQTVLPADTLPEFVAPAVGLVTKAHDMDTLVYSSTTDDWRVHRGIDITAAVGSEVCAAADGVVLSVRDDPMMGKTVVISHNGGAQTIYSNLGAETASGIEAGAEVHAGQVIGCVGDTAMLEVAEEPHLHFEMKVGGSYVDPMDFISASSAAASLSEDVSYEG